MSYKKRTVILLLIVIPIIYSYFLVHRQVDALTTMGCTNSLEAKEDSLDRRYVAFLFRRFCGATAPDSMQVNIQPQGTLLDSDRYKAVLVIEDGEALKLRWEGDKTLTVVNLGPLRRIHSKEDIAQDGVHIKYINER